MRKDMAERFSETKGRYKKSKYPRRQKKVARMDEDGHPPTYKGMKKVHVVVSDWYHDNGYGADYSILRRFLKSHIGQSWDDVYSEICAETDSRSHDGFRLRESVKHLVELNTSSDEDGNIFDATGSLLKSSCYRYRFFVHPERQTLEYLVGDQWRYGREKPAQKVFELEGLLYHKHDDIWYKVEMKPVPSASNYSYSAWFQDVFHANEAPTTCEGLRFWAYWGWQRALEMKYGHSPEGKLWYCETKQSAGKREISKLKKKYELE